MEIVDIGCPRSIDLLSVNDVSHNNNIKSILQTINIYDHIIIKRDINHSKNVLINPSDNISLSINEKMHELLLMYAYYIGEKINNISVDVNYDNFSSFMREENILAGFLIGLNYYYKHIITTHELVYLANKINPLISYFITGGYKEVGIDNNILKIKNNPYNKYYLLEHCKDIDKVKEIINNQNIKCGFDNYCFITSESVINPNILIKIKKEISNIVIRTINNAKEPKVLVKYLK